MPLFWCIKFVFINCFLLAHSIVTKKEKKWKKNSPINDDDDQQYELSTKINWIIVWLGFFCFFYVCVYVWLKRTSSSHNMRIVKMFFFFSFSCQVIILWKKNLNMKQKRKLRSSWSLHMIIYKGRKGGDHKQQAFLQRERERERLIVDHMLFSLEFIHDKWIYISYINTVAILYIKQQQQRRRLRWPTIDLQLGQFFLISGDWANPPNEKKTNL